MNLKIRAICEKLAKEPIFHMSLHSKELFHSNVIAWFFEAYPKQAYEVLSKWVPSRDTSTHRIQREHKHLDLVIEIPGLAPVVIENKVFSPPDDEQLNRYSSGYLKKMDNPSLILLSLGNPNWDNSAFKSTTGSEWRFVSYRELADALQGVIGGIDGFSGEVLRRYCEFISMLQELIEEVGIPSSTDLVDINSDIREVLHQIRLHDAMSKVRARHTALLLRQSMNRFGHNPVLEFDANFTNGEPLLEAFVQCENGDRIGWQYQGQQWRLAVITKTHFGRTNEQRDLRHSYVAEKYADWFDFDPVPSILGRQVNEIPRLEMNGEFNGYNPDFVYRYRKITNLRFFELEALSLHYISLALKFSK